MIENENTSPSERAAAEARVEERGEELARLRTQIQERDIAFARKNQGDIQEIRFHRDSCFACRWHNDCWHNDC